MRPISQVRDNRPKYVAVMNVEGSDKLWEVRQYAAKHHLAIFVGYAVPCPATAEVADYYGGKGVYLLRSQADKAESLAFGWMEQ